MRVAAPAFVDAAIDDLALRQFLVGDAEFLGLRLNVTAPVGAEDVERWRGGGARLIAFRLGDGDARPPAKFTEPLQPGDSAIVAGPAKFVRSLTAPEFLPEPGLDTCAGFLTKIPAHR